LIDDLAKFSEGYNKASSHIHIRLHSEVLPFFDGFDLVEPGLVQVSDWRPDPDTEPLPVQAGFQGGVGLLAGS